MVALVNSARLAAGKSSLGWINPALYQLSASFAKDITEGANNCAANARVCCGHGYSAMPGWDPVTGLGSVDFEAFKEAMMELGDSGHSPAPLQLQFPEPPPLCLLSFQSPPLRQPTTQQLEKGKSCSSSAFYKQVDATIY